MRGIDVPDRTNVEIAIERIPGDRWADYMVDAELDAVTDVARQVGHHSGYIANGGIVHRDFHANNVWVDERTGEPVVTDWGMAYREEPGSGDMQKMLDHTADVLDRADHSDRYGPMKEAYLDGFREGADTPWDVTADDLQASYRALC